MSKSLVTPEMLEAFKSKGGEVTRLNTMSPATGQIRGYIAKKRKELEDEGIPLDEMPYWCLSYQEQKERGLLVHQRAKRSRQEAAERAAKTNFMKTKRR